MGWRPRRVPISRAARTFAHGRSIVERAAALGIEIVELPSDRLMLAMPEDPRGAYAAAKSTLAVVVAPPSKRKLQPIVPSTAWRVDLAEGCPAHCSYCYLAGSLKGPPITRVYANLDEILGVMPDYLGQGTITSRSRARAHEGTTFEASCYTDPLALELLTGSLSAAIRWFARWQADAQLRFTSKFAADAPLLALDHEGRTRMRASVNPGAFAGFEGGTLRVAQRLTDLPGLDLTIQLIANRFTPGSKAVLDSWYPGSSLDMSERQRAPKRTKFGSQKQVYDAGTMRALRGIFERRIADAPPSARTLYWT